MRMSARFFKSEVGEVSATITLERGGNDPGVVSIDGMAYSFGSVQKIEKSRQFGRHGGKDASDWAETVIADIKHQIDEFRTSVPADYSTEY